MIIGGLRLVTRGDNSRQGEVSRELAVLDPPGDWTGCGGQSSGITADSTHKKIIRKLKNSVAL
jgi:hypothetical protein